MSLFSSKSKSTSTTSNNTSYVDNSRQSSGTVGDLSKSNLIAGGDATMYGYNAEDTQGIIDNVLKYIDKTTDQIKDTTGEALKQVSSAYGGATDAILQNQSETKTLLNSLQPFAFAAAAAFSVWAIFGKKGR